MGGTAGHVSLGFAYLTIGLWHLFNCIKLHSLQPNSYLTLPWFPVPGSIRCLEPIVILSITLIFIATELSIRNPISPDGTITTTMLRHVEHSIIALSFFICACFSIALEKKPFLSPVRHGLVYFLQAVAFGQQLLILHVHSTDHMGIEGQYHWLLQIVTFVSLLATLGLVFDPRSFLTGFIRGFSVSFQGVWLVVMGFMLWTPSLIPKGCFLKSEPGREALLCHGDRALDRAKALVNIEFGLYLSAMSVLAMLFYLVVIRLYPQEKVEYQSLMKCDQENEEGAYKVDKSRSRTESKSTLPI